MKRYDKLSKIELEVISNSNKQISDIMGVTTNTVKAHLSHLYSKLDFGIETNKQSRRWLLIRESKNIIKSYKGNLDGTNSGK